MLGDRSDPLLINALTRRRWALPSFNNDDMSDRSLLRAEAAETEGLLSNFLFLAKGVDPFISQLSNYPLIVPSGLLNSHAFDQGARDD